MKKILIGILLLPLILYGSIKFYMKNPIKKYQLEKQTISRFEKNHGEKFWFIDGLRYPTWSHFNDDQYRGMIYNESLRELDFPLGIRVSTNGRGNSFGSNYEYVMAAYEFNEMVEPKLREIFGDKANIDTSRMETGVLEYIYKLKNGEAEGKTGIGATVVEIFVDDLDAIDEAEYRQKTFEFASYLYNEWNVRAYLQIFVRDDSFFENYDLVKRSVFPDFMRKKEVKDILKKIKRKNEITEEEKQILVNNFWKNLPNKGYIQDFWLNTSSDGLKLKNVKTVGKWRE